VQLARLQTKTGFSYAVGTDEHWIPLTDLLPDVGPITATGQLFPLLDGIAAALADTGAPTPSAVSRAAAGIRFMAPVVRPSKIVCIGLNYADHLAETGADVPASPVMFAKWPNTLAGPRDALSSHQNETQQLDYEGELAVVIGQRCRDVPEATALSVVGAYAVANDVSARDRQFEEGGQWTHSKSFDQFCPLGPWLTTADQVEDPNDLVLTTVVNGMLRQRSSTGEMIFSVPQIIAYLTQGITLEAGDLILTGTPAGVAMALPKTPWLAPGDVVTVAISGLGQLENAVVAHTSDLSDHGA
jgi:2-keto-4-pentenoate hydratase/2-oxohepta-3-ene-1,7-dioic acid hydratase in catechol pathway